METSKAVTSATKQATWIHTRWRSSGRHGVASQQDASYPLDVVRAGIVVPVVARLT